MSPLCLLTQPQQPSNVLDMEHPNLGRLRRARSTVVIAERAFRAEVRRALSERPNSGPSMYTAMDVATAAGVSRARVYQIRDEGKAET